MERDKVKELMERYSFDGFNNVELHLKGFGNCKGFRVSTTIDFLDNNIQYQEERIVITPKDGLPVTRLIEYKDIVEILI